MVIPKGAVETVGIKKTSLPSPGSNCCFEKNPHLKVWIRRPFWFGHILAREGGVAACSRRAERCPQAQTFFGSQLLLWGPGYHRLTLGGRAFWSPW